MTLVAVYPDNVGMRTPHLSLAALLLLPALPVFPEDQGRLASTCADSAKDYCKWIARYVATPRVKASEQADLREALAGFDLVQPVQVKGDEAAALVSPSAGEFQVIMLKRVDNKWAISKVLRPSDPDYRHRR